MWNHSTKMSSAMAQKKIAWPHLSAQEMTDLLVYLQNLPQTKGMKPEFSPASAETGKTLFQAKGCADCHKDAGRFAAPATSPRTLGDFAAAMWNHSPQMKRAGPTLNGEEMRRIVGYLWSIQFFNSKGNATAGKRVFEQKRCASCHASGAAPKLAGANLSAFQIVSALWKHGPNMLAEMRKRRVEWPRFKDEEMANLLAHLSSGK
jgi:cytochrome c551/c552